MGSRKRKLDGVDAALRSARAEASDELVAALSGQVLAAPRPASGRAARGSRVAFALALTVLMLGTFASFGGLGYAATSSTSAGATQSAATGDECEDESGKKSSAGEQYCEEDVPSFTPPSTTSRSGSVAVAGQSTAPQAANDTLPFTGYGLGGTALIGGTLLALGVFLRRREARE